MMVRCIAVRGMAPAVFMAAVLAAAPSGAADLQVLHDFTAEESTALRYRLNPAHYPHVYSAPVVTADGTVYGATYRAIRSVDDPYSPRGETRIWRWDEDHGYGIVGTLPVDARARNDLSGERYDTHAAAGTWLALGADGAVYGLTEFSETVETTGRFFRIEESQVIDVRYRFPTYRPDQYAGSVLRDDADPGLRVGSRPKVGLALGADGQFYGATSDSGFYYRAGGLYRLSPAGEATLMMGPRNNREGLADYSVMTGAADGHLYGINWHVQTEKPYGPDIYRLTVGGVYEVIHNLTTADFSPQNTDRDSLQQGIDGWLYGTSNGGGDDLSQISQGGGVIFRLRTDGSGLERVHTFSKPYVFLNDEAVYQPSADGAQLNPIMVRDAAGNFYGTTQRGGAHTHGVVFRLSPDGELAVLHAFGALDAEGRNVDGAIPLAGVALNPDQKTLYGLTSLGGENGLGTVFALTIAEPPPQASITWTFNPITVGADLNAGGATILKWASSGASACTASGGGNTPGDWSGDKPASGELLIIAANAGIHTYTLTCSNAAGLSGKADSVLTVRENAAEQYGNGGGAVPLLTLLFFAGASRLRRKIQEQMSRA